MIRFIVIISALSANVAFCQSDDNQPCHTVVDSLTSVEIVKVLEKQPTVDGGNAVLYKAVSKNLSVAHSREFSGDSKLIGAFIVGKNGEVLGKRTIKNIQGTDLAERLLEILHSMKWQPGICNGKPVASLVVLPMTLEFRK